MWITNWVWAGLLYSTHGSGVYMVIFTRILITTNTMNRSYCAICRSQPCSNWSWFLINIRKKVGQRYFSYFQELRLQHMIEMCDSIEVETNTLHNIFKGYFVLKYGNGWTCVSHIDTILMIMRTGHFHLVLRRQHDVWFYMAWPTKYISNNSISALIESLILFWETIVVFWDYMFDPA